MFYNLWTNGFMVIITFMDIECKICVTHYDTYIFIEMNILIIKLRLQFIWHFLHWNSWNMHIGVCISEREIHSIYFVLIKMFKKWVTLMFKVLLCLRNLQKLTRNCFRQIIALAYVLFPPKFLWFFLWKNPFNKTAFSQ